MQLALCLRHIFHMGICEEFGDNLIMQIIPILSFLALQHEHIDVVIYGYSIDSWQS